jgi:predicted nucleic acid-binding protein
MTNHLLDTDTIIDALKLVRSTLDFLEDLSRRGDTLCTNDIVLCEVYAGLHPQDVPAAEQFLATLTYLPTSATAARVAGGWKYRYARQGQTLSHTDCLNAACAQEHQATVITGNVRDYPMLAAGSTLLPLPRITQP